MSDPSRTLAPWATGTTRRSLLARLLDTGRDVGELATGWRWGRRPLIPRSAETHTETVPAPAFPTAWARTPTAGLVRSGFQRGALAPLVRSQLTVDVHGADDLAAVAGPVLIAANHGSHLDAAVVLTTLPPRWRRRTAVAAAADYFFDTWWRAGGTALAFNAFPLARGGAEPGHGPGALLADGWSLLFFPEGTRSRDGFVGSFSPGFAALAQRAGVPVVPVGLRGTYAAMPRGRALPRRGRPRVSVRYGLPLRPADGESPAAYAERIQAAVQRLIDEDTTTWWATQRAAGAGVAPPEASWRRIWQQSEEPAAGGRPRRGRIWRP
jgi:1-acyl-sn-glycerol-3-phosphate acyltransferase